MEILFIITLFIIAALTSFTKRKSVIEFASVFASLVAFLTSIVVAFRVASSGTYTLFEFFSVDALSAIIMLIVGFVGFVATIYSVQYLRAEVAKGIIGDSRSKQYFILLNFFLLAMFLAVMTSSPIFSWICIEITTLSTAFLISFYNKPSAIEAAWKYLIINSIGLLLGFFGTLLYFTSVSSLSGDVFVSWHSLVENAANLNPLIAKIAFIFVLIGYGTKVGLVPMHTWKPDAYSKAPAPIGALLSGALLPIAFTILIKFKLITDIAVGPLFSQRLLIIFGLLSVVVAALIMFTSRNYKRLLAYSSIENAGIIALGFGFGGLGIFAALLHLIYHSLVKATLFFSSGNLLLKYNSAKINNIKNALSIIPITSIIFITGFFIIVGTPPFGIFLTKMYIFSAGIKTYPIVSFVALFFVTIVFIGFLKHVTAMFFGEKSTDVKAGEGSVWLIVPPVILLVTVVVLSFYIPPFMYTLITSVVSQY